jgi:hypothetical protein
MFNRDCIMQGRTGELQMAVVRHRLDCMSSGCMMVPKAFKRLRSLAWECNSQGGASKGDGPGGKGKGPSKGPAQPPKGTKPRPPKQGKKSNGPASKSAKSAKKIEHTKIGDRKKIMDGVVRSKPADLHQDTLFPGVDETIVQDGFVIKHWQGTDGFQSFPVSVKSLIFASTMLGNSKGPIAAMPTTYKFLRWATLNVTFAPDTSAMLGGLLLIAFVPSDTGDRQSSTSIEAWVAQRRVAQGSSGAATRGADYLIYPVGSRKKFTFSAPIPSGSRKMDDIIGHLILYQLEPVVVTAVTSSLATPSTSTVIPQPYGGKLGTLYAKFESLGQYRTYIAPNGDNALFRPAETASAALLGNRVVYPTASGADAYIAPLQLMGSTWFGEAIANTEYFQSETPPPPRSP